MNKLLRSVSLILIAVMLTLLCACAGENTALDSKKPVTVTLWHYYVGDNQTALEDLVSSFNTTVGIEKGVIIEPVALGSISELETRVTASAKKESGSDPMPDIFSCYPDVAYELDKLDVLFDLNAHFSEEERGEYLQGFLNDGIFDDKLLVIPIVKSTELFYVNATTWREFCSSEGGEQYTDDSLSTWESIYETSRAFYEWSDAATPDTPWDGTAMMGIDTVANYIIVGNRQLGVEVISKTEDGGEVLIDLKVMRRLFDIYYKGHALGYMGAFSRFRSDDLKQNDLIAYVGSSSGAAYFPSEITDGNNKKAIDFLPIKYPVFEGGEEYAIQQGAGMCVSKSDAAHQEGAALFLKWLTKPENNISFATTTGYLPVHASAMDSELFTETLNAMSSGDKNDQIVAESYKVVLEQLTEGEVYAAKPFEGSYSARFILQSSLESITAAGKERADELKAEGLSEAEILERLDVDARFDEWIINIKQELTNEQIHYREQ